MTVAEAWFGVSAWRRGLKRVAVLMAILGLSPDAAFSQAAPSTTPPKDVPATASSAKTEPDPFANVEEMIVTGSVDVAPLLDAPISVVSFDQKALDAMGAQNISDLAEYTPNLEINSPYAASNPQLFIRGVGLQDSNSNASSAVMVVVDGVNINSPAGQLSSLYDIKDIAVLRGPQGALYGRNASAGAVSITTNPPVHEVKAGANLTYGRFNQLELDGMINVPVVQDVLATRFAFKYTQRDPLGENRCHEDRDNPFPPSAIRLAGTKCYDGMVVQPSNVRNPPITRPPKQTHDRENWFARSVWLLEPAESTNVVFNFHGGQNLGMAPQFQNRGVVPVLQGTTPLPDITRDGRRYLDFDACHAFQPNGDCLRNDRFPGAGDPFSGDYSVGGKERLTLGGINANVDWTSGPWSFINVASVEYNDREVVVDFDASPYREADAFITDSAWQVFDDAKLTWDDETGLALTIGAQYFQESLEAENLIWNSVRSALGQKFEQKTYAAAGYGYLTWELSENLFLEGGARATYERKTFWLETEYNPFVGGTFLAPLANFQTRELSEQVRPSGEIIMRYEPTDDVKLYARFTRGYKGRHFNGNALSSAQDTSPVKSESINAYEAGFNTSFLDGLIKWDGAAFYYDYENQQVYQLLDSGLPAPVPVLLNAEDSRNIGMESAVTLIWEGITFNNSIGANFTEYSDFTIINEDVTVSPGGGVSINLDVKDFSGNQLVNAPEFSYVGFILYDWEMPWGGTLSPRFDYRYKSQVFYTPENDSRIGADPRWLFDARVDYKTPSGNIGIAAWVRNLTDEFYAVTAYDRKKRTGSIVYVVSEPRTFGFTVSLLY